MQIKFHGNSCFSIKDGEFTIVTDPYDEKIGLKMPSLKANVVTVSQQFDHTDVKAVQGEPKVFNWPGEYEVSGHHFVGIASFHNHKDSKEQKENTIFKIEFNGVRLCHLGGLGTKLTSEQLEQVGEVDILLIPVGGKDTIEVKKTKEVIEQIEPRIIIPMLYNTPGSKAGLGALEPFLSEMGAQNAEQVEILSVKRSEMPEDMSKVVVVKQTL